MSELVDPNEPDKLDELHDLLLANYILLRRLVDIQYISLRLDNQTFADELLAKHERGEFLYPDVFTEEGQDSNG